MVSGARSPGEWIAVNSSNPCICGKDHFCRTHRDSEEIRQCMTLSEAPLGWVKSGERDKLGGQVFITERLAEERRTERGSGRAKVSHPSPAAGVEPVLADPEVIDRVYSAFLQLCPLSPEHRLDLERRGLSAEQIQSNSYGSLGDGRVRWRIVDQLVRNGLGEWLCSVPGFYWDLQKQRIQIAGAPGMLIPVYDLDGRIVALKIRLDVQAKGAKYVWLSSKSRNGVGPGSPAQLSRFGAASPSDRYHVVEGILKADVAAALSGERTIGIGGVAMWPVAVRILDAITAGRASKPEVVLCYDGNAWSNANVARQFVLAYEALRSNGYPVVVKRWPGEVGWDDALLAGVEISELVGDAAEAAVTEARALASGAAPPAVEGRSLSDQLGFIRGPLGLTEVTVDKNGNTNHEVLCNFNARVLAEILLDDGADDDTPQIQFEVEAAIRPAGQLRRGTITPAQFDDGSWVTALLGVRAIVPRRGDLWRVRTATQVVSDEIETRRRYTSLGWRLDGTRPFYVHAAGGISADGVAALETLLPDTLRRYELPSPCEGAERIAAVRASLSLLNLGPAGIAFPMVAAVARAVLGQCDFALHLVGQSGSFKSELAALIMQHFGAAMTARRLPGNWSSTENALEGLGYATKDAAFAIDDFAPHGTQADIQRLHARADRLIRGAGNGAGRGRMRADSSLRPTRYTRGLIVSTGEDLPAGYSVRARTLFIEIAPGNISAAKLTKAQADAASGQYALALACYLRWLASRIVEIQAGLPAEQAALRDSATARAHSRTPGMVADLVIGLRWYLRFAAEVGAVTDAAATDLARRAYEAISATAERQSAHQRTEEPTARYLELVGSAIASGEAHLAAKDGERPAEWQRWGWRSEPQRGEEVVLSKGRRIGWVDGDHVFLDLTASFEAAQKMGGTDGIKITSKTLAKRLSEKKLLRSSDPDRSTVKRRLAGQSRNVLHLSGDLFSSGTSGTSGTTEEKAGENDEDSVPDRSTIKGNIGNTSPAPTRPPLLPPLLPGADMLAADEEVV